MTTREQWILYIGVMTLAVAIVTLAVLLRRGGRSIETKAVLDAVEGARRQVSTLEQKTEGELRTIRGKLKMLLIRFGFLHDGESS